MGRDPAFGHGDVFLPLPGGRRVLSISRDSRLAGNCSGFCRVSRGDGAGHGADGELGLVPNRTNFNRWTLPGKVRWSCFDGVDFDWFGLFQCRLSGVRKCRVVKKKFPGFTAIAVL